MKRFINRTWKWAVGAATVIAVAKAPFEAYDTYQRYRDVLGSLLVSLADALDDARTAMKPVAAGVVTFIATATAPSPVNPPTAPLREVPSSFALQCAGANQINSTVSAQW